MEESDAGEAAIALLSPTSMLEEGSMRYTTSSAMAAPSRWRYRSSLRIAQACRDRFGTYDANSVGKRSSGGS